MFHKMYSINLLDISMQSPLYILYVGFDILQIEILHLLNVCIEFEYFKCFLDKK